jgi:hypothetical protein
MSVMAKLDDALGDLRKAVMSGLNVNVLQL